MRLVAKDGRYGKSEQNCKKGGVGHQIDTDRVDKEQNGMGLTVEEFPFNNNSYDGENERKYNICEDCKGTVLGCDLLTEERSPHGQESLQLHQDKGQQVVDFHIQTNYLVDAKVRRGVLAIASLKEDSVNCV